MFEENISSEESEGFFHDYIEDRLKNMVDEIINGGNLDHMAGRGSDVIVEVDDIQSPQFEYDRKGNGGKGAGNQGPGNDSGKLRFSLPFNKVMQMLSDHLNLPNLTKEGDGKIKVTSEKWNTFGISGSILDKKRTFKRALKSSIAQNLYEPTKGNLKIQIRRGDRRFKQYTEIEKPLHKAVVFFMGDISYSTSGERLELEKKLIFLIKNWIDYNYGIGNVEHRFFVHEAKSYEVREEDFFRVSNAGGTMAFSIFEMVMQVALSEYDPSSTNFYAFYFGDGEVFGDDSNSILRILDEEMKLYFNRVGVVEILPGHFSNLYKSIINKYPGDKVIRAAEYNGKASTVDVIKKIFAQTKRKIV